MFFRCGKYNFYLYYCAVSVNFASFIIGCCFAWTSPAIPRLNGLIDKTHNPLGTETTLTPIEESLIASLVPLGAALSSLVSGYLSDKRGRKESLIIAVLISIIGFGFMHFANALIFIYVARFICGLAVGIIFAVVPVYLGEIAEDKNRGVLGMFLGIFIMSGILFTNAIGSVVTLNTLNLVNFAAPILFMASFDWFVPESPYWLVAQKRFKDAEKSLRKIRQCPEDKLNTELEMIKKNIQETFNDGTSLKDWLRKKEFLRGIFITCSLVTFQQLSGINIILFYMQSIFEETGSSLPSDLSTIIISVVQILACTISSIFIDNLGRKILLIFSGVGTCLSLIAFGVYFYLKEAHLSVDEIFWLPIVSIIFFMIAYASGFGPVPFVVLSEVFQQRIKSSASTITIFVCLIGTFCTTTFFPPIITYLGMSYVFWMLAVFCFISAVFTFWFVPETKGKSLQEIQQMMQK